MDPILSALLSSLVTLGGTYLQRESHWNARLKGTEQDLQDRLDEAIASSARQVAAARAELEALQRAVTYYEDVDHLLVLDGPSGAGKSALVAKWTNPSSSIERLRKTAGLAEVHHFLCAEPYTEDGLRCERRHRLKYWDVPGERPSDVVAAFDDGKPRFVVVVVDPESLDRSLDRHSTDRLVYLYGRRDVRESLLGALIYISKSDKIVIEKDRRHIEEAVRKSIVAEFSRFGVQTYPFWGSALTGAELPNAMGYMVERLGLRTHFPKHASLA